MAERGNPTSHQASFIGGEWSFTAQGRLDKPQYKTALNVMENAMPIPSGAFVRRSGLEFLGPTYQRNRPRLLAYRDIANVSYLVVLTEGQAQFYSGTAAVFTQDGAFTIATSTSASGVLTVVTNSSTGWAVGDQVKFQSVTSQEGAKYHNRVLQITAITTVTITLKDDTATAFSFDSGNNALTGASVVRLQRSTHGFSDDTYFDLIRPVQAQIPTGTVLFMVERHTAPQVITGSALTIAAATFKDGPYLDYQGGNLSPETGVVNAYSGTITFTPLSTTFVAADVGRHIRLYSEPLAWDAATTYAYGTTATFNGQYWKSMAQGAYASANLNIQPGTVPPVGTSSVPVSLWAPDPTAGRWAWGTIATQSTTSCTIALTTTLNSVNGTGITAWRMGVFMADRYPACGIFHEGRLWFAGMANSAAAGAPQGLFAASTTDDIFTFSPTDIYGNVADNHGFTYTLSSKRSFTSIRWMEATDTGDLLFGSQGPEWLVEGVGGSFTSTTVSGREITDYASAEVDPERAGMSLIFVQRYGRTVYEYLADAVSSRYGARPMNEMAKHLVASASDEAPGFYRLAYQQEKVPVVWGVAGGSALLGCTYRRTSRYLTEDPDFEAWHRHIFASGERLPIDVCTIPGSGASKSNFVYVATQINGTGVLAYDINILRPLMDGNS